MLLEDNKPSEGRPIMTYALWIVQGLLALLFLFTGGVKLVLPLEVLTEQTPLPGWFVRFLGWPRCSARSAWSSPGF